MCDAWPFVLRIGPSDHFDSRLPQLNISSEATERMALLEFWRVQLSNPLAIAHLMTSSFPYILNGPAVMIALCERFSS